MPSIATERAWQGAVFAMKKEVLPHIALPQLSLDRPPFFVV